MLRENSAVIVWSGLGMNGAAYKYIRNIVFM